MIEAGQGREGGGSRGGSLPLREGDLLVFLGDLDSPRAEELASDDPMMTTIKGYIIG